MPSFEIDNDDFLNAKIAQLMARVPQKLKLPSGLEVIACFSALPHSILSYLVRQQHSSLRLRYNACLGLVFAH